MPSVIRNIMVKFWLALSLLGLLGGGTIGRLAAQQGEITFLTNEAIVNFPEEMTFRLEIDSPNPISEATLNYRLGQNSCLEASIQIPVEVEGPTLEWTWIMSRSGNPPPGAQINWSWTLVDEAGNEVTSPEQQLTFEDNRFDWRTVEAESSGLAPIKLHWYRGDVGPTLLDAAVAGLERLESDTGIKLEGEVEFFIYGDSADMREALLYVQDWAGGIAFSEYNTILIGVPPSIVDDWGVSTVRHELAHLVIGQFARSCLGGSLPTWLSEGLAVYAEGEPNPQTLADIEDGIKNNTFQPVRSLNGAFPARGSEATAAYSQSYSLVAYLLDTYGQEKIQELLAALADADGYDEALETVYGFNADGLETVWREAIGAPPRQIPPTPTPILASNIATVVPLGSQLDHEIVAQATPEINPTPVAPMPAADAVEDSRSICGIGLAPLMVFAVGAGVWRSRGDNKRKQKPARHFRED